jgi:lambda repressor-like predicted transcriptional regulator
MPSPSDRQRLTLNALANAAQVDRNLVYRAVERGILTDPPFAADVIVAKVWRIIADHVWPGRMKPRAQKNELELWQVMTVQAVRELVGNPKTTPDTTMWILQGQVLVAHSYEERAALEGGTSQDSLQPSPLDGETAIRIPIGRWIDDLPARIQQAQRRQPRTRSRRTEPPEASEAPEADAA